MNTRDMYAMYQSGMSLRAVAESVGLAHGTVRLRLIAGGYKLRPRREVIRKSATFNGRLYTLTGKGYYRATSTPKTYMHVDVWEFHNGPVPKGHDVHHVDENKQNNDLSNLALVEHGSHTVLHRRVHMADSKTCRHCGGEFRTKPGQSPHYLARRAYCSQACWYADRKGKPRTYSPRSLDTSAQT